MKIDLGCGQKKLPDHIGVDLHAPNLPDIVADIRMPIPGLDPGCADHIACNHVLEHLRSNEWLMVMIEIARLLKPAGTFEIRVPHPSHDCAMVHDHKHVFIPSFWRDCQEQNWLGGILLIDEVEEIEDPRYTDWVMRNSFYPLSEIPAIFLRNTHFETAVRGHKP